MKNYIPINGHRRKPRPNTKNIDEFVTDVYSCPSCDKPFDNWIHFERHRVQHDAEFVDCHDVSKKSELLRPSTSQLLESIQNIEPLNQESDNDLDELYSPENVEGFFDSDISASKSKTDEEPEKHLPFKLQSDSNLECIVCYRTFIDKIRLLAHQRKVHPKMKRYRCPICQELFGSEMKLVKHLKIYHPDQPDAARLFKCVRCTKSFFQRACLNQHMLTHTKTHYSQCHACQKIVIQRHLKVHLKIHSNERPYSCPTCESRFKTCGLLKQHMLTHKAKRFQCQICRVKFTRKVILQNHTRIHTGEKPYQCEICLKKFTRLDKLKEHSNIHTGAMPFECKVCGEKFMYRYNLYQHKIKRCKVVQK